MNTARYRYEDAEAWQAPGTAAQWSDSFYFAGGDQARGTAFYTRIGRMVGVYGRCGRVSIVRRRIGQPGDLG